MPKSSRTPQQPSPLVRGCSDAAVALLALALELVVGAVVALERALTHRSAERADPGNGEPGIPPPETDWSATLAFGTITVAAVLIGVVLVRRQWPWTGWTQLIAAFVLVFVTVSVARGDYRRSHPAPAGAPLQRPADASPAFASPAFASLTAASPAGASALPAARGPGVRRSPPAGRPRTPCR
ncbi:DUF6234 family protein [Streptomyces sp. AM 2-1-1]|uniref:DUF6234 family protein n=1 Tax=Streptomyces sp. AM 2-1-1 TaxID=3028709 RepID=UPI0023B8B58C|nr:DUF6234 family protein [Streptomyces sp. AM 2-1-1]WEH41488.1 DUF6234 family protein [Streptomyces sp. AM 2-1-1]